MGEFGLGQPVARTEDPRLLRGGGRYIDDIAMPNMAYGYVLRSLHAHAKIKSIDTTAAKAAPGVLAVLTGEDWKAAGLGDLPVGKAEMKRGSEPMFRPPYPALAQDRVRWVGDYVAFVVAETLNQAIDAAELIEVDYELLPTVVSTADAAKPGMPLVWDDCPNNICYVHPVGDKAATDRAIATADHVVRQRFVINRVTAVTMEPRGCVGHYDVASDRYTIHSGLQRAFSFRKEVSSVLKVPESSVHVIAGDIGGSFGMKTALYNEAALVLFGSKVTGRPVKWVSTRSEAFLSDAQGRDNVSEAELALDRNGKFLALRVKTTVPVGAYLQAGGESSGVANIGTLAGVYIIPAMSVEVTTVFTNTNPMRPYRGNGRPEAGYVIERMVDLAADELKIDPAELRRRNMIPPEAMPYKTALVFTYDCGEFEKSLDLALQMSDYAGFEARRKEAKARGKLRGIGLSFTIERAAGPGLEGAEIRFDRSGTVTVLCGSVSQGQGHETTFKQLVCDRLGVDPDDVHYIAGDTDAVAFGEGTGGSRSATIGGSALHSASAKIVDKGKQIAAQMLGGRRCRVRRRRVPQPQDQSQPDHRRGGPRRDEPKEPAGGHGAGADRQHGLPQRSHQLPQRLPRVRGRDRRGDGRGRDRALHGDRRRRHGAQPAAAQGADPRRRGAGRRPDPDGRHPVRSGEWAALDRLVHGLCDAARSHLQPHRGQEQPGADQDQPARLQGCGRSRQRRCHARHRQRARRCAVGLWRQACRDAGDAGAHLADDRGRKGIAGGIDRPLTRLRQPLSSGP